MFLIVLYTAVRFCHLRMITLVLHPYHSNVSIFLWFTCWPNQQGSISCRMLRPAKMAFSSQACGGRLDRNGWLMMVVFNPTTETTERRCQSYARLIFVLFIRYVYYIYIYIYMCIWIYTCVFIDSFMFAYVIHFAIILLIHFSSFPRWDIDWLKPLKLPGSWTSK